MLYTFSEALDACGFTDKLKYDKELEVKNNAIALFLEKNMIMARPKEVIASPMPNGYRTTTKRRAKIGRNGFSFGVDEAPITEPREHQEIYTLVEQKLQTPPYRPLAEALNWVILRGSYTSRTIIFNVRELNAPIVRKLKQMAEHLQKLPKPVTAAHVYVAKTSDYYLEMDQPTDSMAFKQLYGPKELALKLDGFSLKYPVTGFSQINESQVRNMLAAAKEMAQLDGNTDFMDLYCGYGLFGFGMGEDARSILGVEWTGESIECAKRSAAFLKRNAQFVAGRIDSKFIEKLPKPRGAEVILLDPPRKGTLPGVIEALGKRKPRKVVHIFCGTDEIPRSIKEWDKAGYMIEAVQPLDMFPKVKHMETLICLVPRG